MNEENAKEICTWEYEGEYAVYNLSDWDRVVENNWELAVKEEREASFLSVTQDNQLVAYGVITIKNGIVLLGIGLKPSLCGKGLGADIMKLLIEESENRFPGRSIALEVRSFNRRAIRCYENIGFEIKDKYLRDTLTTKNAEFYYMEYEDSSKDNH
ncbi:GNAT family N-acetyltransferase [Gudongella sp. DL1XJH-153]|uniref:GNAT family N-acetyltransferase n=1 Tax=Gudongella sp. DL1XJH-153 TaxID=3409804 RepID=UPI003BB80881